MELYDVGWVAEEDVVASYHRGEVDFLVSYEDVDVYYSRGCSAEVGAVLGGVVDLYDCFAASLFSL